MTLQQLQQIKAFAQPLYTQTGRYHAWDHIELVTAKALELATEYPQVNQNLLTAACYLHDIGRIHVDKGHAAESVILAEPFLQEIKVAAVDIAIVLEAVGHHDKDKIKQAESIEAKILFDADKLQILSVFGFTRCLLWLVEERQMEQLAALDFLYEYCQSVLTDFIQTPQAKKQARQEFSLVKKWVAANKKWIQ